MIVYTHHLYTSKCQWFLGVSSPFTVTHVVWMHQPQPPQGPGDGKKSVLSKRPRLQVAGCLAFRQAPFPVCVSFLIRNMHTGLPDSRSLGGF